MTLQEFIDYLFKMGGIDFDGAYGRQCVDLFREYHKQVIGASQQPRGVKGAKDFWTNYNTDPILQKYYNKIPNTPDLVFQPGDVVVWKHGEFGHIAVRTNKQANLKNFETVDQNWTSNRELSLVNHNYNNVYGVLRPKGDSMPSTGIVYENIEGYGPVNFGNDKQVESFVKEFLKNIERITDARNQRDDYKTQLEVYKSEYEKEMKDIKATMAGLEESAKEYKNRYKNFISSVAKKLDTNQEEPAILAELTRLVVVEDDLVKAETKNAFLNEELDTRDEAIRRLKETLKDTQEQLKVAKGLKDATNSEIEREYWSRKIEFLTDFLQKLKNIVRK